MARKESAAARQRLLYLRLSWFVLQKRLTLFCSHVIMVYITEILHNYYVLQKATQICDMEADHQNNTRSKELST